MDSYPEIYESYARFCRAVGYEPQSFENWMRSRDTVPHPKLIDEANELIRSSVPGQPVPACAPCK